VNDLVAVFGESFLTHVLAVETMAGLTEEGLSGEQRSVADKFRAAAAQTQDQSCFPMLTIGSTSLSGYPGRRAYSDTRCRMISAERFWSTTRSSFSFPERPTSPR
jgi:hypothetical protein